MKAPENMSTNRGLVFLDPTTGADDLSERSTVMRRFTRSLVVLGTTAVTGLAALVLPLAALAFCNGGPGA
jgi:hypothetical protein